MPELGKATYVLEIDSRKFDRDLKRKKKDVERTLDDTEAGLKDVEKQSKRTGKQVVGDQEDIGKSMKRNVEDHMDKILDKLGVNELRFRRWARSARKDAESVDKALSKLWSKNMDRTIRLKIDKSITGLATAEAALDAAARDRSVEFSVKRSALNRVRSSIGDIERTFLGGGGGRGGFLGGIASVLSSVWSAAGTVMEKSFAQVGGSVGGMTSSMGTAGKAGVALAGVLGVILVAAIGSLVVAITILVGSLAQATLALGALTIAGVALMAVIGVGVVAAIVRFKDTVDDAGSAAAKLKQAAKDFGDAFKKATAGGADKVLQGAASALRSMSPLVKSLKDEFTLMGGALGDALTRVGKEFSSPDWQKFFSMMFTVGSKLVGPLTNGFLALAGVLRNIAQAAAPTVLKLVKKIGGAFEGWQSGTQNVKNTRDWLKQAMGHLRAWWNLLKTIGGALGDLFGLSAQDGKEFVNWLTKGIQGIRNFLQSAKGSDAVKRFFRDTVPLLKEMVEFVGKLLLLWVQVFQFLAPSLQFLFTSLNALLDALNFIFFWVNKIGPGIRSWLIPFAGVLGHVSKLAAALFALASGPAKAVGHALKAGIGGAFKWIAGAVKNALNWVKGAVSDFKGAMANIWGGIKSVISSAVDKVKSVLHALGGAIGKVAEVFRSAKDGIVTAFNAVKTPVVNAGKAIIGVLAKIVRVVAAVINAFSDLKSAPGDILGGGVDKLGDLAGSINPFQKGGAVLVPGTGNGDKVPAMLEPGEVVWNKRAVAAMGGPAQANAVNSAVPRFAEGGAIGSGVASAGSAAAGYTAAAAIELLRFVSKHAGGNTSALMNEATRMNGLHQPYLWGGGHGAFSRNGPWDCSGAVSQVLHGAGFPISSPMVSGAFTGYGLPGLFAGNTGIWANAGHVWMTINGKGFSTSAENPGHGWGDVSYNSRPGFVKRHPNLAGAAAGAGPNNKRGQPLAQGAQRGGVIGLAGGGVPGPRHGARWPHVLSGSSPGGRNVTLNEGATLLWSAGASESLSGQLSRVLPGESWGGQSSGTHRAHNPSGASGLWQIMMPLHADIVGRYGGNVYDPRTNALSALAIFGDQGFGAWEASRSGPPGKVLRAMTSPIASGPGKAKKKGKGKAGPTGPAIPGASAIANALVAADLAAELAGRAETLDATVQGKNTLGWLADELAALWLMRDLLIRAYWLIQQQVDLLQGKLAAAKTSTAKQYFKGKIQGLKGLKGGILGQLAEIQGPLNATGGMGLAGGSRPPAGTLGGRIFDVQSQMKQSGGTSADDAVTNLKLAESEALIKRLMVSNLQGPVFSAFAGSFHGGGVIGGSGDMMAHVRTGEGVFTPDQMEAMGGSGPIRVEVAGDILTNEDLKDAVKVWVGDKLAEDVSVARRST